MAGGLPVALLVAWLVASLVALPVLGWWSCRRRVTDPPPGINEAALGMLSSPTVMPVADH